MAADLPHLLSVDKIKHKYEKTNILNTWQKNEIIGTSTGVSDSRLFSVQGCDEAKM